MMQSVPTGVARRLLEFGRGCAAEMRARGCDATSFSIEKGGERCSGGISGGCFTFNISRYDDIAEQYSNTLLYYSVMLDSGEKKYDRFRGAHFDGYCATTMVEIMRGDDVPSTPMSEQELATIIAGYIPQVKEQMRKNMGKSRVPEARSLPRNGGMSDIKW